MAAHFQEEQHVPKECGNCGCTEDLALCARCHSIHFCSRKCQRAYWPFHKEWCRQNDFADAAEKTEPKFARWMRKHGKMAVLKDDEVDRIERKVTSMEDLYGRAQPKPRPPEFDADDMRRMKAREETDLLAARAAEAATLEDKSALAYRQLEIEHNLGEDCGTYKWRQTQTYVEVFVPLPATCVVATDVSVNLTSTFVSVRVRGEPVVEGELHSPIKAEASTWVVVDGVLEMSLLKRNRRGNYDDGCTNADTFWYSVCLSTKFGGQIQPATGDHGGARRLALTEPPHEYYDTDWIADPEDAGPAGRDKNGRGASSRGRAIKGRR